MDIYAKLSKQSLARELTAHEAALANALESIYVRGIHAPNDVCAALNASILGNYTPESLEAELTAINTSLDKAYAQNGIGA
jgi:hypothetical protein